ncbi:MAG: signal peptidase II [Clostridia bacterium]|nr:signal peptidase II [Clostridia bacterium]
MNLLIIFIVFLADRILKLLVMRYPENTRFFLLPDIVEGIRTINTGAAFSLFRDHPGILSAVSILLILLAVGLLHMARSKAVKAALAALIGGALGNLLDRFLYQGVTDYIHLLFVPFPIFNFADICITCGAIYLLFYLVIKGDQVFHD